MKKSSKVKPLRVNEEISKKAPAISLELKHLDLDAIIQMGMQDFMFQVGMIAVQQAMAAEVETLAGPRYVRDPENPVHRWGQQQGCVYVNGQKVNTEKPRVRSKKSGKREEIELQTYKEFSKPTAMNETIMAKVLAGVSMRDYEGTIDQVIDGHGVSRSAVSRRAVKESAKQLEEFYARRFDDQEFVVIMLDGIGVADVDNIVAMGIDVWGKKQVLGIRQGATENTIVCSELLEDLVERGLPADGNYLFVVEAPRRCLRQSRKCLGRTP